MAGTSRSSKIPLLIWIFSIILMIYAMIVVGGLTRLTGSGLSIVEWKPISGVIPPLTEDQWLEEFAAYKNYPEYQKVNKGMSLDRFKEIYWWEYGHRVLGRGIGFVFFIPFLYFLIRRRIKGKLLLHLSVAFVLGGFQGLLGWYMVKSGLIDQPRVSHFRLAAHLSLALFLLIYLFWLALGIIGSRQPSGTSQKYRALVWTVFALVALQIFYGALVAGLDAGLLYNTFPDWNGMILPIGISQLQPVYLNFFSNPVTVQLIHRTLAYFLVGLISLYVILVFRNSPHGKLRFAAGLLLVVLFCQFCLGIATLLMRVPVSLGSLHQAFAVLMLIITVWNVHLVTQGNKSSYF